MNFVWILVGGSYDNNTGNHQRYALLEYSDYKDNKLEISDFNNTCNFWNNINEFNSYKRDLLNNMLKDGKKFLCRDSSGIFGYRDNEGYHSLNSDQDKILLDQLSRLVFDKCIK